MDKNLNLRRKKGSGRPPGAANKTTRDVREIIAVVAEKNAKKIDGWLARIARKSPERALDLYLRMIEYHIPKLSRLETVPLDKPNGRVIDSSKLTAEEREQMRQIILRQMQAEPALLEQQASEVPRGTDLVAGLGDAQVVDCVGDSTEVRGESAESQ